MPAPADWRQHLEIETPEHVVLDYELAGLGSRGLAAVLDTLLVAVLSLGVLVGFALAPLRGWLGGALLVLVQFLVLVGYFIFFEAFRGGQTPGKRWMGIRVVHDTGHALTLGGAVARNLLRVADFLPPPYLLGGLLVAIHPRAKRLGDLVAGTVVVRDQPQQAAAAGPAEEPDETGAPELDDAGFRLLSGFHQRAAELDPQVRARLAAQVAARLGGRHAGHSADGLEALYRREAARRRGRLGGRQRGAERFVARQAPRWAEFDRLAARVARGGLDSLAAEELPDFAGRYREVAADLARARTYGAAPAVVARLERLVAAGHNALYRRGRTTTRLAAEFLFRECPATVLAAWRPVALAAVVFLAPGVAGYVVLREDPPLAWEVLPDVLLERAESGRTRLREGAGYFQAPPGERPLVATSIITNNLRVAFSCFAFGIFAGVGSLVALAYNGLMIGAASGHFANRGLLGYLWTFVAGHGFLELFAIWVAGAAGFLLGRALIAPGRLSRTDALVVSGRAGLRLVAAASLMLLLAGLIEGFVSASGLSLAARAAASAGSVALLGGYLAMGLGAPGPGSALAGEAGRPASPNRTACRGRASAGSLSFGVCLVTVSSQPADSVPPTPPKDTDQ